MALEGTSGGGAPDHAERTWQGHRKRQLEALGIDVRKLDGDGDD